MGMLLGCIADDFTGATDLAAILSRSGVPVSLHLGLPDAAEDRQAVSATAPFEIIALKCRTAPPDEAVADAVAAGRWLIERGALRLFWKYCSTFDSRPEGNIGPVADALLATLDARRRAASNGTPQTAFETTTTVHCPAFPENGRSVYLSNLFVGEQPLDESPMKDHPLTPMRDANLVRLLTPQVSGRVDAVTWPTVRDGHQAVKERLDRLTASGIEHVVVDALDDTDLLCAVRATEHLALLCGGSALALHLPALFRVRGWLTSEDAAATPPAPAGGRLVLAGSCSAMTRRQVAAFAATEPSFVLDPIALATGNQLGEAKAWLQSQTLDSTPLIASSASPERIAEAQAHLGGEQAGRIVEQALAALAITGVDAGRRGLVVAGGETSGAVCQALGIREMQIGREIAPGVPWTHVRRVGGDIAIALKSGNFGQEGFFRDALDALGRT